MRRRSCLFIGRERGRRTAEDRKVEIEEQRAVPRRARIGEFEQPVAGGRPDHGGDAADTICRRPAGQALDGELGALFLVVLPPRVVDRIVEPDRGLDRFTVGKGMILRKAKQRLDMPQVVIMPVGRRIGANQFGANRVGHERHANKAIGIGRSGPAPGPAQLSV